MGVKPTLQVAIDDPRTPGLPDLLATLADSPADLLEIGTPFLTGHGLRSLDMFLEHVPRDRVYVDTKCIDLWESQVIPFVEAGALHLSIHALLEPSQADELLGYASKSGVTLYVSNLGIPDALADKLNNILFGLGYRNFVMHGEGSSRRDAFARAISKLQTSTIPLAARRILAGGIDSELLRTAPASSLGGIIVGRSVTQSANPAEVAASLKELLEHGWRS